MLLLHGFTGSSRSWPALILDGLTVRGLAPVALDLPGHGARAGERAVSRYTLDATLAVIAEAQRAVPGPIAGYSMGGRLALAFAVAHPERITHLVLESASPGLATPEERAARRISDEALAASLEHQGLTPFLDAWEAMPIFESQRALPPDVLAAQRARRLANDPAGLAASLRGVGTGVLPSFWESLERLDVPTLLLAGRQDGRFRALATKMASALPLSEVAVIPGAGHAVHLERPASWLDAVLAFLRNG